MPLSSQPPRPTPSRARPNYPRALGLGALALIAVACGGSIEQNNNDSTPDAAAGTGGASGGWGGSTGAGAAPWPEDAQVPPDTDVVVPPEPDAEPPPDLDAETPIDAGEPDSCDDGGCEAGDPNIGGGMAESFNDAGPE